MAITYNVLNLQQSLSQSGTTVASYNWLADGTKCAVVDNTTNGYDYLGSLIYTRNGSTRTLESTDFGGGRIVYSGSTYSLYYYITDHLGSIRTITDNSGIVREQNDYYPFGGRHANSNYGQLSANKQKFNGKELQTTGNTWFLDYGARMYDDVIGRWGVVDPMAEKRKWLSPYNFVQNNPFVKIDPNGKLDTGYRNEKGEKLFETNDGLNDIIIVPEKNIDKTEKTINKLNDEGKLNDPKANKEELHTLGVELSDYVKKYETGNSNQDAAFPVGYLKAYNGESLVYTDILYTLVSSFVEGAEMKQGYRTGKKEGLSDKKEGKINIFDPFKSLKNNTPIIKIK